MDQERIYGNHVGIVINNEDPEKRNRIQIFVPYISATLYDDWNAASLDIEIGPGSFDKIDAKILARLKLGLPWAEAALPVFGGNGSVSFNKQSKAQIIRSPVSAQSPPFRSGVNLDESGKQIISSTSSALIQTGPNTAAQTTDKEGATIKTSEYGNYKGENAGDINSLFGIGARGMLQTGDVAMTTDSKIYQQLSSAVGKKLEYGDVVEINGQKLRFADTGSSDLTNRNVIDYYKSTSNGAEVDSIMAATRNVTVDSGSVKYVGKETIDRVPSDLDNWIKNAQSSGAFKDVMESNGLVLRKGAYGYPSGYRNEKKDWPQLLAEVNSKMGNKGNAAVLSKYGPSGTGYTSSTAQTDSSSLKSSSFKPLKRDPSAIHANSSYNNISAPGGVHSKPQIGTMVWVFFFGGNVMKPVYFAGVSEPQSIGRSLG